MGESAVAPAVAHESLIQLFALQNSLLLARKPTAVVAFALKFFSPPPSHHTAGFASCIAMIRMVPC